jgi:fructoselysine-6-P-deglycase FrlB-like protein
VASASLAHASAPPAAKDVKDAKKKTDNTRLYWLAGGAAALLALIAAVVVVVMKKRGKRNKAKAESPSEPVRAKPSLWARLSLMLMLLKKSKKQEPAAE